MKAPQTTGSADRNSDDHRAAKRAPRTKEHGPIGFAHVMAHTKRAARGAQAQGAARGAAEAEHEKGAGVRGKIAALVARDEEKSDTKDAKDAKDDATTGGPQSTSILGMDLAHLFTASSAPTPAAAATTVSMTQATAQHNAVAQPQQTMTAQAAVQAIYQNAASMTSQDSVRELVIQLEPEHLGPLVVKMKLDGGRLTAEMHVSSPEAAAALRSGSAGLQERLRALGYSSADVTIDEQPKEYFDDED